MERRLLMTTLNDILRQFSVDLPPQPFGNGHINSTYVLGDPPKYILQRINTNVFRRPEDVMENVVAVTEHLRAKLLAMGGDAERGTLRFLPTVDGKFFYRTPEGDVYRMYRFVSGAVSYESATTPELFAESARAFGRFQRMLSDFPAEKLHEVIPRFHDTRDRLRQFREALAADRSGRAKDVEKEVRFVLDRADNVGVIASALESGDLPLRVTHNDTKLNNVLLDEVTGKAVCVIDLDTVMPGSLLYDYGDSLRFGASSGAEDEQDLSKIWFDLDYFAAYTDAYLSELRDSITPREIELLPYSAWLITLEIGMRFLADHIDGDRYFRIHRDNHNLDRARTQFQLVADIEKKTPQMNAIVSSFRQKYNI